MQKGSISFDSGLQVYSMHVRKKEINPVFQCPKSRQHFLKSHVILPHQTLTFEYLNQRI